MKSSNSVCNFAPFRFDATKSESLPAQSHRYESGIIQKSQVQEGCNNSAARFRAKLTFGFNTRARCIWLAST